jgi:polysaccharide export outer membrane protein
MFTLTRFAPFRRGFLFALFCACSLGTHLSAAPAPAFSDFNQLTGQSQSPTASPAQKQPPPTAQQTATATIPETAKSALPPQPVAVNAGSDTTNVAVPSASLAGYVADDKYRLRVGDKISLQILEDRDAPKSLVIADSGELDSPYAGRVAAADKTCKQLGDELKSQLEKEYYHRATVVIALDVANKLLGRIYVWGQVRNQGPLDISVNESLTVGKAILRAGGFGDFANKKKVQVIRPARADGGGKQTFILNMADILEKGKTEKDIILQPDDSIIVPERTFNL